MGTPTDDHVTALQRQLLEEARVPKNIGNVTVNLNLDERVRPSVLKFALAMEAKLAQLDDVKGGRRSWRAIDAWAHYDELEVEVAELEAALAHHRDRPGDQERLRDVLGEAVDVANFAMIVADACGALHPPEPEEAAP